MSMREKYVKEKLETLSFSKIAPASHFFFMLCAIGVYNKKRIAYKKEYDNHSCKHNVGFD